MDHRLVAWARAVKARRRSPGPPPLWLFTDSARTPDLARAIAGLPRGLCGVVFRHDGAPGRASLARAASVQCRARRIPMVLAGGAGLAFSLGVGVHLREGRGRPRRGLATSSAHGAPGLVRAGRAGVGLVFLSPAFATASHAGAPGLGPSRWLGLRRRVKPGVCVAALGGIDGNTVRRLGRRLGAVGAIGALLPSPRPPCGGSATVFRNCHG